MNRHCRVQNMLGVALTVLVGALLAAEAETKVGHGIWIGRPWR